MSPLALPCSATVIEKIGIFAFVCVRERMWEREREREREREAKKKIKQSAIGMFGFRLLYCCIAGYCVLYLKLRKSRDEKEKKIN